MAWTIFWIVIISLIKILITCMPTGVVEWITSKFEVHPKLNEADVTLTIEGKTLEGEGKSQIIRHLNEAAFLEKHYIYPGTEDQFLHPENNGTSIIIDAIRGKQVVRLFVFCNEDQIDVVKQYKKKLTAYSLRSDHLQKSTVLKKEELA
ncbi:YfmQ family protein [Neobacillus dielmonensis]|uniref:YfmQ family protein n=1 Tax=Neobacillus dielmonensis TaxID=1347369 RepID=UPI0005A898E5|nr:YfmQ family protein [Neobacillus dielmonensis]